MLPAKAIKYKCVKWYPRRTTPNPNGTNLCSMLFCTARSR